MFSAENITAGEILTLSISGTPKTGAAVSATTGTSQTNLVIGLGIFGAVLVLAGLFFFLRSRNSKDDMYEEDDSGEIDALGDNPDQLMDAIASLDDQFKAGTLAQEAYHKRRDELKARLKDIL